MNGIVYRIRLLLGLGKWRVLESDNFTKGHFYRWANAAEHGPSGFALKTGPSSTFGRTPKRWAHIAWGATDQFEEFV